MRLLIIKHGKTDYNLEGKRQGRTDLPLCDEGKKQVKEFKGKIKGKFSHVISSPMKRALETAQLLFPDKTIQTHELLIEYDFGELEGVTFSTPLSQFPNNKVEEYNGIKFLIPNEGETFKSIVGRCEKFIKYLKENFKENDKIAIITHSTNLEILKALMEGKAWYTYLAQAKQFHGFVKVKI
ncbi:histidine phosphatase family protein [Candidatus Dojkabacteria bacterium]|nr:histidine phosphatase family protein [Candidatus Dojkabacteria bacterium]